MASTNAALLHPMPPPTADEQRPQLPVTPATRDRQGRPKLLSALRGYSFGTFTADAAAGLTVGLVALPLAMAFAIASGLPPQTGLHCAIVTGFLISALGGSRVQIGGPTGGCLLLVSSIAAQHGTDGLFVCTAMAGVMLVLLGATGLGTAVDYIPRPVVLGLTNGIAVLIASTQIKDFFGLTLPVADGAAAGLASTPAAAATAMGPTAAAAAAAAVSGEFISRMIAIGQGFPTIAWPSTILAVACLIALIVSERRQTRVPGAIMVLVGGTLLAAMFTMRVETIDSRFQGIAATLTAMHLPATFRPELLWTLLPAAFTIALLGAIESARAALVADRFTGDRHDPNVTLVAQGVANLAAPFFGGLPAAGALTRTATNVRAGARTPMAGIIHAVTLLLIVLFAAPLVGRVPLAVLAAIVLMIALHLGEWRELPRALRMSRTDAGIWLVTFGLTVFADLTQAVAGSMALAALLFIRTIASTTNVVQVTEELLEQGPEDAAHAQAQAPTPTERAEIPPYAAVFRITGPLLVGGTDKLSGIADRLDGLPPIVILRLAYMPATDTAGLRAIEDLADTIRASGRAFLLSGAPPQPSALMTRARLHDRLGPANISATYEEALTRAQTLYQTKFQPGFPCGA